ncbi:hypothetical protein BPTFM16_02986 [Altererythrobacter insulae]|nr:hypothetical protein BPTFM16_02986 [Altererythrobacter insulae]
MLLISVLSERFSILTYSFESIAGCNTLLKILGVSGLLIQLFAPLAMSASCKFGELLFSAKCILLETGINCAIIFFKSLNAVAVWL